MATLSKDMAREQVQDIARVLRSAEKELENYNYDRSIMICQECVEKYLKTALRLVSVNPKDLRMHELSRKLLERTDKFPDWFKENIPKIEIISKLLDNCRIPAKYGNENLDVPPRKIFESDDAKTMLRYANFVKLNVSKLCHEY